MTQEDFEKIQNNIREKLGDENMALISDDITTLMTNNSNQNSEISSKDNTIKKLQDDKNNLIQTNGNLMQKISMGFEEDFTISKNKEENKTYSIKDSLDEKGNFK